MSRPAGVGIAPGPLPSTAMVPTTRGSGSDVPSVAPPGSPVTAGSLPADTELRSPHAAGSGAALEDAEEKRLEQLIGVRSSKASYYARWQGARRDLGRALAALRALSDAMCNTALGPAALCDGVLQAVGTLLDAQWAACVLTGADTPPTGPTSFTWRLPSVVGPCAPSAQDTLALAVRVPDAATVLRDAAVLGVPMRLGVRRVGTLLVGMPRPCGEDGVAVSILETMANQIAAALRQAWLYEHSEYIRRQAIEGWAEAERRADELTRRNEQLKRARGRLARARRAELLSAERHRIARDLHDGVAQCLVGIGMHLEWCQRHQDRRLPGYDRVAASKDLCRSALESIRAAVFELSQLEPPGGGLGQSLRELAVDFRSVGQLHVGVRVRGTPHELPPEVEHSLVQICQEGLWNVLRHARAHHAWLQLRYTASETVLTVSDDGRGQPGVVGRYLCATGSPGSKHGLRNIAERTREIGGCAAAEHRRGGGLRLRVRVPAAAAADRPQDGGMPDDEVRGE